MVGQQGADPANATSAEDCKQRGNDHIKKQEFDQAVAAYSEAIELNPKAGTYWLNRAIAYRMSSKWEPAASDAEMAAELEPTNVKAHYIHALCLQHLKKYDRALQACEVGLVMQADSKALLQIQREVQHVKEQQDFKEERLSKFASIFARETPRAPSRSSSSSESSSEDDRYKASFRAPKKSFRVLTDADAPNQELCAAALSGDLDECTRLLESGSIADLNWKTPEEGNTALHVAADADHEPIVRALLDAKANTAEVNDFGLNPFCLAARGTEAYKLLLRSTRRTEKDDQRRNARKTRGYVPQSAPGVF